MSLLTFLRVAQDLDSAGLLWQPEIGDEISQRSAPEVVSILIDPQGMTPTTLRETFVWLPTVEQLVHQLEARKAILFHAGLELNERALAYKTVVQVGRGQLEATGNTLRDAIGCALRDLLLLECKNHGGVPIH
jgi:hypothetical protein